MLEYLSAEAILGFLKRAWPYILGVILIVVVWRWDAHRLHVEYERGYTDGRAEVQAVFDQYKTKQEKMVTALALLWSEAIQKVEVRYVEVVKTRVIRFSAAREASGKISGITDKVVVPVPSVATSLLRDIWSASNATPGYPGAVEVDHRPADPIPGAAERQGSTDTTLTDWIKFATDAGEAYRDAEDKRQACVSAYATMRQTALSQTTGQ